MSLCLSTETEFYVDETNWKTHVIWEVETYLMIFLKKKLI